MFQRESIRLWGRMPRDSQSNSYLSDYEILSILRRSDIFPPDSQRLSDQIRPLDREVLEQLIDANDQTADLLELNGLDISGADLRGLDLSRTTLSGCNLSGITAKPLIVSGGQPYSANDAAYQLIIDEWSGDGDSENKFLKDHEVIPTLFRGAICATTRFTRADLSFADFSGAIMPWADFSDAALIRATLDDSVLNSSNLSNSLCVGTSFVGAKFRSVKTSQCDLRNAKLNDADIDGTVFGTTLIGGVQWQTII